MMEVYREGDEYFHPPIFQETGPLICNRLIGEALCGQPGEWHIIWNADMDNGVACGTHLAEAKKYAYVGCHPMREECFMPGRKWRVHEDICVVDEDGLGLRSEREMALVIDGSGSPTANAQQGSEGEQFDGSEETL